MKETKQAKLAEPANLLEEEEEVYPLVYNMWITNLTIHNEGGTVIFQTGRPKDEPKP